MNKRAALEFVVGIVIVLLSALALFTVMQVIQEQASSQEPIERCLLSVKARALAKSGTSATVFPLDCDRDIIFLEDESPDQVNARFLQEIKDCARSFGDGMIDFSTSGTIWSDQQCALCSSLEFSEDKKAQESYVSSSWKAYTERLYRDPDTSWAQFFEAATATSKGGLVYKVPETINANQKYLVFFKYTPTATWDWLKTKVGEDVELAPVIVVEQFPGGPEFTQCQSLLN